MQSSNWFSFNYSFWLFLSCTWKKRLLREWEIFLLHWVLNFLKISIFSFPFLIFINFKITTNSFIYPLVEQFLETHFHKNNYWARGILLVKIYQNFRIYILLTWGVGILYEQHVRIVIGWTSNLWFDWFLEEGFLCWREGKE